MGEEQEQAGILDDPLRDAETVISAFGGVRPMASRLGIAATTIQGWKSRKNIPENRRQMVLEAVQADGLKTAGRLSTLFGQKITQREHVNLEHI